jgi:ADP-ribose pyrophosphatase
MSDARLDESKLIYKGRIFTVTLDTVGYPDGRTVNMEVVRHPGSVVLIPMPAPDRVLLVRQYRYVVDRWLWELAAGTMEPGESAERAALRECQEEVAKIARQSDKLLSLYPSPGFCDEVMHFFLLTELRDPAEGDSPAAHDPDELLHVQEFSLADAREMVRKGEIDDMKTVVGLSLV